MKKEAGGCSVAPWSSIKVSGIMPLKSSLHSRVSAGDSSVLAVLGMTNKSTSSSGICARFCCVPLFRFFLVGGADLSSSCGAPGLHPVKTGVPG